VGRLPTALCSVNASLYDRLGGAALVAALVDDAVDRLAANPALAPPFCGKDLPQLRALGVSVFSAREQQGGRPNATRCRYAHQPGSAVGRGG